MSIQSNAPLSNVESNLSADEIVAKFTGTPDGTKFLRDDGTLAAGGSGSAGIVELESLKTSAYTTTTSDQFVPCSHASTPFTVTLHAATGSGQILRIKNRGAAAVTVDGNSSETIDGALTVVLAQYSSITLVDAASGVWDIV